MEKISLEAAVTLLIGSCQVDLESESLPLLSALGRIISEDVVAKHHQPPFDRSPLDGYAVRGEDTSHATAEMPVTLEVIDEVCAGHVSEKKLEAGQCIRIMTGGPMPAGSNGVIKQEDTNEGIERVDIFKGIKAHQNYCYAGEDYKAGEVLLTAGENLSAYHIGLLASNGITDVSVKKRLRIGLMSTGDELIEPSQSLSAGKIYNSNLYTLQARLIELGCEPVVMGTIQDDVAKGIELIKHYSEQVDLIVTTGGVSVGKMDIMHPIFDGLNVSRLFWRLKLKPGTPALAGIYNETLLLCLSGNPSAASITFELLFRPLLAAVTACEAMNIRTTTCTLGEDFHKKSPTRRFIKAMVDGSSVMMTKGNQSSGVLKSMIGCNAFVDVAEGTGHLNKGDDVKVILL